MKLDSLLSMLILVTTYQWCWSWWQPTQGADPGNNLHRVLLLVTTYPGCWSCWQPTQGVDPGDKLLQNILLLQELHRQWWQLCAMAAHGGRRPAQAPHDGRGSGIRVDQRQASQTCERTAYALPLLIPSIQPVSCQQGHHSPAPKKILQTSLNSNDTVDITHRQWYCRSYLQTIILQISLTINEIPDVTDTDIVEIIYQQWYWNKIK